MKQRWRLSLFVLVLTSGSALSGCAMDPGAAPPSDGIAPTPIGGDAGGSCAHPEEGCACEPDQPPIDCYAEPQVGDDGHLTCSRGTRYCRAGAWTSCESIETYELRSGPGIAALVTGPSTCNPCDPACAVSRDVPSSSDLPGHSTGLTYDPSAGGIAIPPDMRGGTPTLSDSDGDGVPDVADDCVGPGAFRAADGSCYGDTFFFHELPYGGPAQIDPLDIGVQVRTADVYFLMDTTGSMGGEIYNLRHDLTTGRFISGCSGGIIGAIRCTIPDAWFGVGHHDDYPISPYGSAGYDEVYENFQDITSSVSAAQTAVNRLELHGGNDGPEGQSQALWAIASGGGLGPYLASRTSCPAGKWGYPCFRDGTIPIVVLFTDAPIHNGPYGYNYGFAGSSTSLPSASAVSGNDTRGSAHYTGDAATTWRGFTGNTCSYGDNYGASCTYTNSRDVVFRFYVSRTAQITVSLEGSNFDTALTILNSSFHEIACNDDSVGLRSKIIRTLSPGTYYAVVQGWNYDCGNYRLSIGNPAAAGASVSTYPVTWAESVAALTSRGIRVITVQSGGGYGIDDANALADATGSYSSSGRRYVFPIDSDGSGLSRAVVDAIVDLANYNRMDISARAVDNPATGGFDERSFVSTISAVSWGPGSCSGVSGGSTFVQCLPGTSVDFRVAFQNDVVMPTGTAQVFDFWVEVVGDGTFVLERVPVRIVVPPDVPLYPPSGSYWRDYDSTRFCMATERPDWTTLTWDAPSMPTGTSIRWELRTGDSEAEAEAATPVTFTTPPTSSPVDVGARLVAAGVPNFLPYLRVTAVLLSNADRSATPVLNSFELRYDCIPTE